MNEDSDFSTSSRILIVVFLFDCSHSSGCEVIPHCVFNLHYPDDQWGWAPFHEFVDHWCIIFAEMSIQIFFFLYFVPWNFWWLSEQHLVYFLHLPSFGDYLFPCASVLDVFNWSVFRISGVRKVVLMRLWFRFLLLLGQWASLWADATGWTS